MSQIRTSILIPASKKQVFSYMMDFKTLPYLLSPSLHLEPLSRGTHLVKGGEYRFSITRFGLTATVAIEVTEFVHDKKASYKQIEGLFLNWTHRQIFEDEGKEGSTRVVEIVNYTLPLGIFGHFFNDIFLRRDIEMILQNRLNKVHDHFEKGPLKRPVAPFL